MAKQYTKDELNKLSKQTLIELMLSLQNQIAEMDEKLSVLLERLDTSNMKEYGRSTEKLKDIVGEDIFNEADAIAEDDQIQEPDFEEVMKPALKKSRQVKQKGKREKDLEGFEVEVITHDVSEEELRATFGEKWKELPDQVYRRLRFQPACYVVEEHHVKIYCSNDNLVWKRAERPEDLMRASLATPSLVAGLMNAKYVNGLPLYRIYQDFLRIGVNLSTQVISKWIIRCTERYLVPMFDYLHRILLTYHLLQADESPVLVTKDGRPAGSKSYMWIYRTGKIYKEKRIILYEYRKTRHTDHPREFLKGFDGIVVTDGYQVYHKLEAEEELKVAGCWSHCRRRFSDAVKAIGDKDAARSTVAFHALARIAAIYNLDNSYADLSPEERQRMRDMNVRPLVDEYFTWIRAQEGKVPSKSKTGKGITYSINQEKYLRRFLEDGEVPLDNNAAEQAIRGFVIGKHNWHLIDTIAGAEASAVCYSIAETAKANDLNPYRYFEYLLTEIPKHISETSDAFLEDLLPWSDKLPEECRKRIISKKQQAINPATDNTVALIMSIWYRRWSVYTDDTEIRRYKNLLLQHHRLQNHPHGGNNPYPEELLRSCLGYLQVSFLQEGLQCIFV